MNIKGIGPKAVRSAFQRLPDGMRTDMLQMRAQLKGIGQLKRNQSLLAMKLVQLEQQQSPRPAGESDANEVPDSRFPDGVRSRLCTQAQLNEPWFTAWWEEFAEPPFAHRKKWEFAYVAQVLNELGQLEAGRSGLGFGVGREPLVSAFANRGTKILATDIASEKREAMGWARSGQLSEGIESMLRPEVCSPEKFRELVSWRAVDMRAIPKDLKDFDFCWSVCALEHLGSLQAGMDFIEHSISTLAPGGIAVHTTEFNLSSSDKTIESGPTVMYRARDVEMLIQRLEANGHEVAALDLSTGDGLLDHYVDVPPYAEEPCLRFLYNSYTLTSVALVVRAGPS